MFDGYYLKKIWNKLLATLMPDTEELPRHIVAAQLP